jgi:hypothetical protein
MTKTTTYAVAALIAAAVTVNAGQPVAPTQTKEPTTSSLRGGFGVDVSSGFVSKGVLLDTNLSSQPYLTLGLPLEVGAYGIDTASVNFSTRQSTNPNAINNNWYRSETSTGITFNSGSFSVTPSYQFVNAPNSAQKEYQEASLTLTYKDTGFLGLPALNPSATVTRGTKGLVSNGTSAGTYYELGITPSVQVSTTTVGLPVRVGVGAGNLYTNNQDYGFTSVGLTTKTPLLKNVFLNSGITYFNTEKNVNQDKNSFWLVSGGLGVEF